MGPQDRLGALLDGMGCTVCDEHVPGSRIRVLAGRDDLLFLQLDCPACGSTSLGFAEATATRPEAVRLAGAAPVSSDDVLDMHLFLDSWAGDLDALVRPDDRGRGDRPASPDDPARRSSRSDARPSRRPA